MNRLLKWVVALGIVIVFNLFVHYSIDIFYHSPQYDDFCVQKQVTVVPDSEEKCVAEGGAWTTNPNYYSDINSPVPISVKLGEQTKGYCDMNFTCGKNFESANSFYNRNIFIGRVILGVAAIVVGFATANIPAVSLGFSFGGVLSFIIGTVGYWSELADYSRVIVLGLALATLVWLGIKKVRNNME